MIDSDTPQQGEQSSSEAHTGRLRKILTRIRNSFEISDVEPDEDGEGSSMMSRLTKLKKRRERQEQEPKVRDPASVKNSDDFLAGIAEAYDLDQQSELVRSDSITEFVRDCMIVKVNQSKAGKIDDGNFIGVTDKFFRPDSSLDSSPDSLDVKIEDPLFYLEYTKQLYKALESHPDLSSLGVVILSAQATVESYFADKFQSASALEEDGLEVVAASHNLCLTAGVNSLLVHGKVNDVSGARRQYFQIIENEAGDLVIFDPINSRMIQDGDYKAYIPTLSEPIEFSFFEGSESALVDFGANSDNSVNSDFLAYSYSPRTKSHIRLVSAPSE